MKQVISPTRSKFQVRNVRLKSVSFHINDIAIVEESFEIEPHISSVILKNDKEHTADVTLYVSIFEKDEKAPFSVKIGYEGLFMWDPILPEEQIDKLLAINASASLYSYIRPVISSVVTSANFPPLVIPMINFTKTKSAEKKD